MDSITTLMSSTNINNLPPQFIAFLEKHFSKECVELTKKWNGSINQVMASKSDDQKREMYFELVGICKQMFPMLQSSLQPAFLTQDYDTAKSAMEAHQTKSRPIRSCTLKNRKSTTCLKCGNELDGEIKCPYCC